MTLNEFKALPGSEMSELMNKYMENHTARNFKSADMNFTFAQAEKAMESKGVYKLGGVYRTEDEMLTFFVEPGTFERLKSLAEKYNYVSSFILREDRGIRIKTGEEEDVRSTSFRVYGRTMDRWKAFVKENRGYTATDLLNTALLEFMDRHGF